MEAQPGAPAVIKDKQRLFDATVCMLVGQGQQSADPKGQCAYRGGPDRQLRCAGGFWIPDGKYVSDMEGRSMDQFFLPPWENAIPIHPDCRDLITRLQRIHDRPDSMFNAGGFQQLLILAGENSLDTTILDAVWRWERLHPEPERATVTV